MVIHEYMSSIIDHANYHTGKIEDIKNVDILEHIANNNFFPYDTLSYYGSRNSGKSHNVYRGILIHAVISPDNILMLRWIQDSIRQSSFSQLKSIIEQENLTSYFKITNQYIQSITTGAKIEFKGLYLKTDSIRSLSDSFKVIVLEECQEYRETELQSLLATIYRFKNVLVIPIFNVNYANNPAYKRFVLSSKLNPLAKCYLLNYYDNPFHTKDCAMERQRLIDKENMEPEEYMAQWEGQPRSSLKSAIFSTETINKLFDIRQFKIESVFISYDPAVTDNNNVNEESISNSNGICIFGVIENGRNLVLLENINLVDSPDKICNLINSKYIEYKASYVLFESNQGGLFVRDLLLTKNNSIVTKEYRSVYNKIQRASSIVNTINNNRVFIAESCDSKLLIDQMKRITSGGFIRNYKNESPDSLDSFVFGVIDYFKLNQRRTVNTILQKTINNPVNKRFEYNVILTSLDGNIVTAIECIVYSINSNYYIDVVDLYQDNNALFSIKNKHYTYGYVHTASIKGKENITYPKLLKAENLKPVSEMLKYERPVDIKVNEILTEWDEYDGSNDTESLKLLFYLFYLLKKYK